MCIVLPGLAPGFIETRRTGTGGAGLLRINLIASPIIAIFG